MKSKRIYKRRDLFTLKQAGFFLVTWFCLLLVGCSESSVQTSPEPEPEEPADTLSGLFYLSGDKIVTRYSEWPIPSGEKPEIVTFFIDFTVNIQLIEDNENTIRFYGLEGADAGSAGNRVFPNCTMPENCKIYGKKTGPEQFEIDVKNAGRIYRSNGTLGAIDLELSGQYQYQNITIDYDLSGEKMIE